MNKKLIIQLLIITSLFTANTAFADYTDVPVENILRGATSTPRTSPSSLNPNKDNNEKLYSVTGKTQYIKFDEPVTRISITDPSLADIVLLSPTELLLNGKKAGRTSLIFWGDSQKPVFFNLVVQQDTDALMNAIEQIAPNENVKFSYTDDGLIMSGQISSTATKKNIEEIVKAYNIKLLNLTESKTKQVLLEVKITEARRNFTKTLQTRFSVGENSQNFLSNVLGITGIKEISNASFNKNNGQYIYASPTSNVALAIDAGETSGMLKILAEPKLLAMDGQPGSFNVGQEVPYPSSVGLSNTTAYSFKNTGVILNFTPTILEKSNRVILKLSPEISELDSTATVGTTPGFKTNKVDTTVELGDGETLIIAGLLNYKTQNSDGKIPWLGDIPFFGFLFSSLSREKVEQEIVIFITPRIVEADENSIGIGL